MRCGLSSSPTMSDNSLLVQVASCLGNSYRNEQHYSGETSSASLVATTALENDHDVSVVCSSLSFPSLSLTHHPERQNGEEVPSPTREEIKIKASACMSQLITENDPSLRSLERDISRRLLENILDSFDQLVDARISQYSKVLSNHGLSLSTKGAQIVEYKLRTLLEIGTNISFGSISTKFESSEMTATTTRTTTNGDKCTTELLVMLTVEIDSLRFHRPMSVSSSDNLLSGNVLQHHDPNKLTFRARGTMQGKPPPPDIIVRVLHIVGGWFACGHYLSFQNFSNNGNISRWKRYLSGLSVEEFAHFFPKFLFRSDSRHFQLQGLRLQQVLSWQQGYNYCQRIIKMYL